MNFKIEEINEVLGKIDFNLWSEYNEFFDVYPTSTPDYFVKVTIQTDSYGEDQKIRGIKIVKGKEKTITVYEVE